MYRFATPILALSLLGGCGAPASVDSAARTNEVTEAAGQADAPKDILPPPPVAPGEEEPGVNAQGEQRLRLSSRGLAFGSLCVFEEGTRIITMTNAGGDELVISSLRVTGDGYEISDRPGLPIELGPGRSATVEIKLTPYESRVTPYGGNLRIVSNDPEGGVVNVQLSGLSLPPAVSVRPAQVDFGDVPRNRVSSRNLTLVNPGRCDVEVAWYELSGAFSSMMWVDDLPTSLLGQGDRFSTSVNLNCRRSGDADATVRFFDSSGNSVGRASLIGYCN